MLIGLRIGVPAIVPGVLEQLTRRRVRNSMVANSNVSKTTRER
jgi:hypothetical protein